MLLAHMPCTHLRTASFAGFLVDSCLHCTQCRCKHSSTQSQNAHTTHTNKQSQTRQSMMSWRSTAAALQLPGLAAAPAAAGRRRASGAWREVITSAPAAPRRRRARRSRRRRANGARRRRAGRCAAAALWPEVCFEARSTHSVKRRHRLSPWLPVRDHFRFLIAKRVSRVWCDTSSGLATLL